MESDFFSKYYRFERTHWWFIIREKIIREQIRKSLPAGGKVQEILNAGTATGRTSEMLQEFGKVTSVEFDPATCEFLRTELGMNVTEASITALPFPENSFDIVCALDVLEHVDDDLKAMGELKRVCRPGGYLYVTVPAFSFLWSRHDKVNHHLRRYSINQIDRLITQGFKVEYRSYFNFLLFFPIAAYRLLNKFLPNQSAPHSDFEGKGLLSHKWLGYSFRKIFQLEVYWLRVFKFPFGVSILLRGRKI